MLDRTRRRTGRLAVAVVATSAVLLAACGDDPERNQTSLEPKGPGAQKIQDLFTPFFWVAVVIGVGVIGGVLYTAWKFRARPGREDNPRQTHGNTVLEVGWTIVPALILAVMAVFTVNTIFDLADEPEGDVVHVSVTGKQWWWELEYTDAEFVTANELHIPVATPVKLELTSDNVIHAFWVPNLAGKKDLAPGRVHELTIEADEPGVYWGQCAEYCGLSHANMRFRVVAQTREEYDAWVATQQEPLSEAAVAAVTDTEGPIAKFGCVACHAFDGVENAGARIGPNLTHVGDRETFAGAIFPLDAEHLRPWIQCAPDEKPMQRGDTPEQMRVGMPCFADYPAPITDEEVDQIVDFLLCDTKSDATAREECS